MNYDLLRRAAQVHSRHEDGKTRKAWRKGSLEAEPSTEGRTAQNRRQPDRPFKRKGSKTTVPIEGIEIGNSAETVQLIYASQGREPAGSSIPARASRRCLSRRSASRDSARTRNFKSNQFNRAC
jgi:hypothetical protein